jgi:hypothetical protein
MCVFMSRHGAATSGRMRWKAIRLELASSGDFPRGSASRSYLLRLPLQHDGSIDVGLLRKEPARATVRRYWPNEADMIGHVVHTPAGYAIRYENGATDDVRLFGIAANAIRIGDEVRLTEIDGSEIPFRVASLQEMV